jgi:hypothetical protein
MQDVPGGIDIPIMLQAALRTAPRPLIEPQLIEQVPAM